MVCESRGDLFLPMRARPLFPSSVSKFYLIGIIDVHSYPRALKTLEIIDQHPKEISEDTSVKQKEKDAREKRDERRIGPWPLLFFSI